MPRSRPTPLHEVFAGHAFQGLAFRVVRACPPGLRDFVSYEALGMRYDRRDFFKGTGVSMFTSRARALAVGRRYAQGSAIASIDLSQEGIVWSPTGRRGHLTVWAAPDVLLARVVQCESDGD